MICTSLHLWCFTNTWVGVRFLWVLKLSHQLSWPPKGVAQQMKSFCAELEHHWVNLLTYTLHDLRVPLLICTIAESIVLYVIEEPSGLNTETSRTPSMLITLLFCVMEVLLFPVHYFVLFFQLI